MSATIRSVPAAERAESSGISAVSVSHLTKAFRIPHEQHHTLKERVLHPFRASSYDLLQAVDDVSVDIRAGEFFGVVGRNGSGKSTLLKCIAGIYGVDGGDLRVRGRLSPFIELGVGFNPELTARDNVMINAIMLGLTRKEARKRFDQIVAFAELDEFLDLKLKNYSSGMHVRLAFSVAIQVDAEILLIDEVLAVGDASFQKKCFDEFGRLKSEGKTIVFVTHDMGAVERFCDRAMMLERGRMIALGEPSAIARRYVQLNLGRTVHQMAVGGAPGREIAAIKDAWFEDGQGNRVAELEYGQPCQICLEVVFNETVSDPVFGATLRNEWRATVFATSTDHTYGPTGEWGADEVAIVRLSFENCLADSCYSLTPSVAPPGEDVPAFDLREDAASLVIRGAPNTGGVVHLPHTFEIMRR
jgi:ABC-type polysaccharide/polyol phosphate transport system ATPase subunit